ncbi:hypothetical protein GLW07_16925 [Bacillus hwajinpoensis]|uniref:Uncharacterized protein n=1 Tax=Guptibacillus hwajinpoensis TaxID=208199 RepID=A0A845F282_9BACL|nr:hypothetical protein [Pseudalkalibacillus hwajinpoensis]MYL65043.1 hypothetical protein [Pseudalkalibacillus hwajinpoensis]
MKLKSLLVFLLLICLTTMTTVTIYLIHNKTSELDISVIVSMVVGGMFVTLGMVRRKHKEEGRG